MVSEVPWSNYKESDYTLEQWHNACLIHQHAGPPTSKSQCKLPVRTPNGALNRNGVHAAAAALAGARSELKASPAEKEQARVALIRFYKQFDEEPPPSLAHEGIGMTTVDNVLGAVFADEEDAEQSGIKGMKWGVRRQVDPSTGLVKRTSSADQIHVDRIAKKLHQGGTSALSNKDLQDFSTRINREQEFNRALASQEAQKSKPFIQRFLATQGKKQMTRVVDKAIDVAVEKALEEAGIRIGKKGGNPDAADLLVRTSHRLQPKKK